MSNKPEEQMSFTDFALKEELLQGIKEAGFIQPTLVQQLAIPVILQKRDVIAQAHTGTGKTAAFGLPCMNNVVFDKTTKVLVLSPTRELAMQTSDELFKLGKILGIRSGAICGGKSYSKQRKMFLEGVHILCATPGRMLDLLKNDYLPNFAPEVVILDEADEMLDMGFMEDIQAIFKFLPEQRQTLMFSATMPTSIMRLAERILKDPVHIKVINTNDTTNENITQSCFIIKEDERLNALIRFLDEQAPEKAIVFCRSREETNDLCEDLANAGFACKTLHGDMDQNQRQSTMQAFRKGRFNILVATDVAARGLDVEGISHVINFHLPFDSKGYVHRIGRTGRAGKTGLALSLVTPKEYQKIERIRKQVGATIEVQTIPSRLQLRQSRLKRLAKTLLATEINESVEDMAQELREKFNWHDLTNKLLAMIVKDWKDIGPDTIGIPAAQFISSLTAVSRTPRSNNRNENGGNRRRRSEKDGQRSNENKNRRYNNKKSNDKPSFDNEKSPKKDSNHFKKNNDKQSFETKSKRPFPENKNRSPKDFKNKRK